MPISKSSGGKREQTHDQLTLKLHEDGEHVTVIVAKTYRLADIRPNQALDREALDKNLKGFVSQKLKTPPIRILNV